jgi:hypothetical protein
MITERLWLAGTAQGGAAATAAAREREAALLSEVAQLREALEQHTAEAGEREDGLRRELLHCEDRIRC